MRAIGVHLRITDTFGSLVDQALSLGLQTFQCFLIYQKSKKTLALSDQEIARFAQLRDRFSTLYVHGAYWINLCGSKSNRAQATLKKELSIAKRLGFTHYVLHPGCATGCTDRMKGIDALARVLNDVLKAESAITIVLENTPHDGKTIGGDIMDLYQIRQKLDRPEKVSFCIDTAHAFAFGYDIVNEQEAFIDLLDEMIGIDAIELIHLNDTSEQLGLKRDRHEVIGKGTIGISALRNFVCNKRLAHVPLIMELPPLSDLELLPIIDTVRQWHSVPIKSEKKEKTV